MLKASASDVFYCIDLLPGDAQNIALIFPVEDEDELLVSIPLNLTMGWKNSPPLFYATTETVEYLANQDLCAHAPLWSHKLDDRSTVVFDAADSTLDPTLSPLFLDPLLLFTNTQLLAYVDVFVDDFLWLDQGLTHWFPHLCHNLFRALDKVFRLLYNLDPNHRKESLSLKNLDAYDFAWSTYQVILGWVVNTVNMRI